MPTDYYAEAWRDIHDFWLRQERELGNLKNAAKDAAEYAKNKHHLADSEKTRRESCPVVISGEWNTRCGKPVEDNMDLKLPGGFELVSVLVCREHGLKAVNLQHLADVKAGKVKGCCGPIGKKHHPACKKQEKSP